MTKPLKETIEEEVITEKEYKQFMWTLANSDSLPVNPIVYARALLYCTTIRVHELDSQAYRDEKAFLLQQMNMAAGTAYPRGSEENGFKMWYNIPRP